MKEKPPIIKKMTLPELMKKHGATLTMDIQEGFANIDFSDENKLIVKLLNEEGYASEENEWGIETVLKIARFVEDLKAMKLEDYAKVL